MASNDDVNKEKYGAASEATAEKQQSTAEYLVDLMKQTLGFGGGEEDDVAVERVLEEPTVDAVVRYVESGKCRNVVTMAGAGISTAAGIPDFRSPGTGLYDNLQKYNLPYREAIFEIEFFKENPEPFFVLSKSLYPEKFQPTLCHYFLRLLQEKGLLLRHYTQNIDTLERVAGLRDELIVEAHGTYHTSHCLDCDKLYSKEFMRDKIFNDTIPRCDEENCGGLIKPDIVFFGESLPKKFFQCLTVDLPKCDLLIIMGTSLVVEPFASLASRVPVTTPRLYINLEATQRQSNPLAALFGMGSDFKFGMKDNVRDVFLQSTCDEGCQTLCDSLHWNADLEKLLSAGGYKKPAPPDVAGGSEDNERKSDSDKNNTTEGATGSEKSHDASKL